MKTIFGTRNRVLEINLTRQEVNEFGVTDEDRRTYLGGKGLGLKYLYERLKPGVDPLAADNYLVLMMGVMLGTGAPCTGRFAALTKSPLTGIILSSSCGGPFGMAFKTAGYDGLLITGKAREPVYLQIDPDGVRFKDASNLWGKDVHESQAALSPGKKDGTLAIGPAGENRVLFANVATGHRFFGRGGMGAVMGAKKLKAIFARGGAYQISPRQADAFSKLKKKANRYLNTNHWTADRYRHFGTSANVKPCNQNGILPIRNFQTGSHAEAKKVYGETMRKKYRTSYSTCKPCTILCGHRGSYDDGVHQIPEYETVVLLGTNLGIFDTDQITKWNDICSRMGLDTMSAGVVLSYLMEAGEKGMIKTDLRFGSTQGVSETLWDIAHRRGQGDELANGTRWLSEKYGGKDFAIHVKGLEMAAYDPRGSWGQGLAYAVANRGACHLSAYMVAIEIYFKLINPLSIRAKAEFTKLFESLTCCVNSLQTCQFTLYAYIFEPPMTKYTPKPLLSFIMQRFPKIAGRLLDFSIYTGFWSATTGIRISNREFLKAGDRIHVLERYMNTREGITRKDDRLPNRFLAEARVDDPGKHTIPMQQMLDKYYRVRGYDCQGIPSNATLKKLDIVF